MLGYRVLNRLLLHKKTRLAAGLKHSQIEGNDSMSDLKMQCALYFASKNIQVFPLVENSKTPAVPQWKLWATTDPVKIEDFWKARPNANIAITGIVGIDLDVKNGVQGIENFESIDRLFETELPHTLQVRTPTGGKHILFAADDQIGNSAGKIAEGIDIRGSNYGYLVTAGSTISGKAYTFEPGFGPQEFSGTLPPCPNWIKEKSGHATRKETVGNVVAEGVTLDALDAIKRAEDYLCTAPLAIQGQHGDETTFKVAAKLKDFGLSEGSCYLLMSQRWNEHCQPPWSPEELRDKVSNAYRYGMNPVGSLSIESLFPDDLGLDDVANDEHVAIDDWQAPVALQEELRPVPIFSDDLLPETIRPWVKDIARRVQCPVEYVAVTAVIALAAVIGKKARIKPKQNDDWTVVPNLWGVLIGRPSAKKSPAMAEAIRPLRALETEANKMYQEKLSAYEASKQIHGLQVEQAKGEAKNLMKQGNNDAAEAKLRFTLSNIPVEPTRKRYSVADATVEKLGELLNENPNGLLLVRDELSGFLAALGREDRLADKAFYLESFNGDGTYIFDRIGRGTILIENMTLSMVGTIQPGKLSRIIQSALNQDSGDDGFIQRFQLAVYPDQNKTWEYRDETPNHDARIAVENIFKSIADLQPDPFEGDVLAFDDKAQELFKMWLTDLETELASGRLHPAMESHLGKYRSLMPSLALIFHFVDSHGFTPVGAMSAQRAIDWYKFLRAHAERIYADAANNGKRQAKGLLEKIREGKLGEMFTVRDILRHEWSGLTDKDSLAKAIDILLFHGYLRKAIQPSAKGRPTISFEVHPSLVRRVA
ncbi:MAG: DUF3987 domain-containing protein [Magnetococcales bacterium]|nr:DUF3987 domain-containing protein [Magnetococcales bacterium]